MKLKTDNNILLKDTLQNYLFVLPALILFATFYIYPVYKVFELSLFEYDGISPQKYFVGLGNFKDALGNSIWWHSMRNAGYITFLALTFQNALALLLALIVDRDIKGGRFYRIVFYLPPVLSGIVIGLIWNWIYDGNYGLLNHWLSALGLGKLARAWLADPKTALTCVGIIHMWRGFGWGFIILLAGLQNIPRELYEAARIDGANSRGIFTRVTVPLMIPVFVLVMILTVLGTMQIYDLIVATTGGGPGYHTEVPITRILAAMIGSSRFGYACSLGLIFGVVLLIVSMIQLKLSKLLKQT
ncbi:MAG: sugar ABC transporter permease [Candidatus Omnitrophica bacterium]|nr:sugar ABC transporter permease [Candidatus Omnitrophota bacterium]